MNIVAHRGNFQPEEPIPQVTSFTIPENTMEAFEKAFENNFGIETDVRKTNDHEYMLLHDASLMKFCGSTKKISEITLEEVKQVKYNNTSLFTIPTLEQLVSLGRKKTVEGGTPFIAFQLKPGDDFEIGYATACMMEVYKLTNCIIFDATHEIAIKLREKFPWLNLSVSLGEKNYGQTIYTPSQVFSPQFYTVYNCVWADEWKETASIYNTDMFLRMKQYYSRIDVISPELHILEGHPLSTDKEKIQSFWRHIISLNLIDGICTDYPSLLSRVITQ